MGVVWYGWGAGRVLNLVVVEFPGLEQYWTRYERFSVECCRRVIFFGY